MKDHCKWPGCKIPVFTSDGLCTEHLKEGKAMMARVQALLDAFESISNTGGWDGAMALKALFTLVGIQASAADSRDALEINLDIVCDGIKQTARKTWRANQIKGPIA